MYASLRLLRWNWSIGSMVPTLLSVRLSPCMQGAVGNNQYQLDMQRTASPFSLIPLNYTTCVHSNCSILVGYIIQFVFIILFNLCSLNCSICLNWSVQLAESGPRLMPGMQLCAPVWQESVPGGDGEDVHPDNGAGGGHPRINPGGQNSALGAQQRN